MAKEKKRTKRYRMKLLHNYKGDRHLGKPTSQPTKRIKASDKLVYVLRSRAI